MRHLKYSLLLNIGLILASCAKTDGEEYAESICDCMQKSGAMEQINLTVDEQANWNNDDDEQTINELTSCTQPILKEILEVMKDMSADEKEVFVRSFIKGLIDTECGDKVLDNLPWDRIFKELDQDLDDRLMNVHNEIAGYSKDEICECVQANGSNNDDCAELMKEVTEYYSEASEEEQKEISEMMASCVTNDW